MLFQNIIKTTSSATIEVFDPDGFSIGSRASEVATGTLDAAGNIVIGTEDGKKVTVNTKLIDDNGTAKVQVEGGMDITVKIRR